MILSPVFSIFRGGVASSKNRVYSSVGGKFDLVKRSRSNSMRRYLCLIAALQFILAGSAHAELAKPTCEEYFNAYFAIVRKPVSLEDDSIVRIAKALADNHILVNQERTEYATTEFLLRELATLSVEDVLLWIGRQHVHLESRIRVNRCIFEPPFTPVNVQLMIPKGFEFKCKLRAPTQKKLPN